MTKTLAELEINDRASFTNVLLARVFDDTPDNNKIGGEVFLAILLEYEAGVMTGGQAKSILGLTAAETTQAQKLLNAMDAGQVTHETLRAIFVLAEVGVYEESEVIDRLRMT